MDDTVVEVTCAGIPVGNSIEFRILAYHSVLETEILLDELSFTRQGGHGHYSFSLEAFKPFWDKIDFLFISVEPSCDFWPSFELMKMEAFAEPVCVNCEPIDSNLTGWWVDAVGVRESPENGKGVKIGIIDVNIDSGLFAGVVDVLGHPTWDDWRGDPVHGNTVARIMAPTVARRTFPPLAPASKYFFVSAATISGKLSEVAISEGIDWLSEEIGCDIIVVAAGDSDFPKPMLREAVIEARDAGTLCLFAGGNHRGLPKYPACYPEVLAVGAIGRVGVVPRNSTVYRSNFPWGREDFPWSGEEYSWPDGGPERLVDRSGTLFLSPEMALGLEIDILAPGIGLVLSTERSESLQVVSGTSFATPVVAGTLAVALARDEDYICSSGLTRWKRAGAVLRKCMVNGSFWEPLGGLGVLKLWVEDEG